MTRNEKKFYRLIEWAENTFGLKTIVHWHKSKKDYKWAGECGGGKIKLNCAKRKYINWTMMILNLAHEIGHHVDDLKMKNKDLSAHSYLDEDNKYIPIWARKVIINHEIKANSYIEHVLEQAGIKVSRSKIAYDCEECIWTYAHLLSNKGRYPTYEQTDVWRRENRNKYYKPYSRNKNAKKNS